MNKLAAIIAIKVEENIREKIAVYFDSLESLEQTKKDFLKSRWAAELYSNRHDNITFKNGRQVWFFLRSQKDYICGIRASCLIVEGKQSDFSEEEQNELILPLLCIEFNPAQRLWFDNIYPGLFGRVWKKNNELIYSEE